VHNLKGIFGLAIVFGVALAGAAGAQPAVAEQGLGGRHQPTLSVLGEFTPSTALAAGAAIEALGFEEKADFTRAVMGALPLEELAALFGFQARDLQWRYGSGGYQQSIAPNLVVSVGATENRQARVSAFAMAWMYVYQQDAVPFFTVAETGRPAVRVHFEKVLTPARESAMFEALIAALGREAGYTRVSEREIVVIDFQESGGFVPAIASFATSMARLNSVERLERFTALTEYPSHDWRAEADGRSLLEKIGKAAPMPGIEGPLRALRARYERLVSGRLAKMQAERSPAPFEIGLIGR